MLNQDSALDSARHALEQTDAIPDFSFRVTRTNCHDEFERRVDECQRLANTASNKADRAFWQDLAERWRIVESRHPILSPPRRQKPRVILEPS